VYVSLRGDLNQEPIVKICASGKAVTMHQPWLTISFDEVECTACTHSWLWGLAGIMPVIMLLLGVKEIAVATFDQSRLC